VGCEGRGRGNGRNVADPPLVALVGIERGVRTPGEAAILWVELTGISRSPLMVSPNTDIRHELAHAGG